MAQTTETNGGRRAAGMKKTQYFMLQQNPKPWPESNRDAHDTNGMAAKSMEEIDTKRKLSKTLVQHLFTTCD